MKKLLVLTSLAACLAACNNAAETQSDAADSVDSIAEERKEVIDSTVEAKKDSLDSAAGLKKDRIDSVSDLKKDALNKLDAANRAETATHKGPKEKR